MGIIILLISISITIAVIFLAVFLWNMKSGQYEDTYTPSVRMLFDDKPKPSGKKSIVNETSVSPKDSTIK